VARTEGEVRSTRGPSSQPSSRQVDSYESKTKSSDHDKIMRLVERRISHRRVSKLLRQWLAAGVMEDEQEVSRLSGTPQGGVISSLSSNIYLHVLDTMWEDRYAHVGELVRYCDDFVVVCRTRAKCEEAERKVHGIMRRLGLNLHAGKTRRANLTGDRKDSTSSAAIFTSA